MGACLSWQSYFTGTPSFGLGVLTFLYGPKLVRPFKRNGLLKKQVKQLAILHTNPGSHQGFIRK
jgi:hypothetical protein